MGAARAAVRGLARALRRARAAAPERPLVPRLLLGEQPGGVAARHVHASAAALGSECPLPEYCVLPDGTVRHKPREPGQDECCGRGCPACVWTRYTQELHDYQAAVAVMRGFEAPLDPFEALERRLAAQTAQLQDVDSQGMV
jgi:hypothetical protein